MKPILLVAIAVGLVLVGAAGAVTVGHVFAVKKGDRADFQTPAHWSCGNGGALVSCSSGDAFPYVDLLSTAKGGITVRVHTLGGAQRGGFSRSVDQYRRPVFTFTAFK